MKKITLTNEFKEYIRHMYFFYHYSFLAGGELKGKGTTFAISTHFIENEEIIEMCKSHVKKNHNYSYDQIEIFIEDIETVSKHDFIIRINSKKNNL
jgi:hypothetical protein